MICLIFWVTPRACEFCHRLVRRLSNGAIELGLRLAQELHAVASRLRNGDPSGRRGAGGEAPPNSSRLSSILSRVERNRAEDILPFWARHAPDEESGGFITHLDRTGRRLGPTDKYLVMQARLIWTFSAAHRHGLTRQGDLDMARQGARFLIDRMWDAEHGGFLWTVSRDGSPLDGQKLMVGQAFAIYGLAEYALASADPQAVHWANRTFDVLMEKAADGQLGFREEFGRNWTPTSDPAGQGKTVGAHLHLMEALTTLAEASGREAHTVALGQIVEIYCSRGGSTLGITAPGTHLTGPGGRRFSGDAGRAFPMDTAWSSPGWFSPRLTFSAGRANVCVSPSSG